MIQTPKPTKSASEKIPDYNSLPNAKLCKSQARQLNHEFGTMLSVDESQRRSSSMPLRNQQSKSPPTASSPRNKTPYQRSQLNRVNPAVISLAAAVFPLPHPPASKKLPQPLTKQPHIKPARFPKFPSLINHSTTTLCGLQPQPF
jgi:hypothetical protein